MMMGKTKINFIIIGLTLYRVAYNFSPFVAFFSPHGLNLLTVFALYGLLGYELGIDKALNTFLRYIPIFFVSILAIVFSTVEALQMSSEMQVYLLVQDLLWVFIISYIIKVNNRKLNLFLLYYVLGVLIVTSLTTFYGCLQYPGLSRGMTGNSLTDFDKTLFSSLNIGGFYFIYTIVLTIPLVIYLYKSDSIKLIYTVVLITPFLLGIYQAEYTTALLMSIVCLAAFFFPRFGSKNKFVLIIILIGLLMIFFNTYLSDFLRWLSSVVDSDIMSERITSSSELAVGMGTDSYSDASSRIAHWTESLNNFIEHPLFGVGDNGGGHSWFLDNMSMFGIWGLIACLIVYRSIYKLLIKPFQKTELYFYALFVFLVQIILTVVNTTMFFEVFIILTPLIFYSYPDIHVSKHKD